MPLLLKAVLTAIFFGIVQGLTEFLPISSTAHLVTLPYFLDLPDFGYTFDIALHAGTLLALLVYFRSDLLALFTGEGSELVALAGRGRFVALLFISAIPAGVAGLLLEKKIEQAISPENKPLAQVALGFLIIGLGLFVGGLLLHAADRWGRKERGEESFGWACLAMGLAQALALIPGVSRSGITMTAGLFLGLRREVAARTTFLISLPIIAGAVAHKLLKVARHPDEYLLKGLHDALHADATYTMAALIYGFGCLAAAVSGYLAIRFLVRLVEARNFNTFVVYRLLAGGALIAWALRHLHG